MFIDLRGPTLKTLHACTGVSTGKNELRCRPLEMLRQAMVFIDSSHVFDKSRGTKYFFWSSVTKFTNAKLLFGRAKLKLNMSAKFNIFPYFIN